MNFRSHSKNEVRDAIANGDQAWALDTATGDDDVLIGELGAVTRDILDHFEREELPEGWELTRIEAEWLV